MYNGIKNKKIIIEINNTLWVKNEYLMREQTNNIDERFRQGFENLEFEGMEAQWESVYATLESKRRRRFGFWIDWRVGMALFILLLMGSVYYFLRPPTALPAVEIRSHKSVKKDENKRINPRILASTSPKKTSDNPQYSNRHSTLKSHNISSSTRIADVIKTDKQSNTNERSLASSYEETTSSQVHHKSGDRNRLAPSPPILQKQTSEPVQYAVQLEGHVMEGISSNRYPSISLPQMSKFESAHPVEIKTKHFRGHWEGKEIFSLISSPQQISGGGYTGFRGGVRVSYSFSRWAFLSSGLSVLYKHNAAGFNTVVSQSSFGLRKTTSYYGVEARHLQYLYAPLTLGMKWQKHRIEVGAGINYFIGAYGRIAKINTEGQPIEEVGKGWINKRYSNHFIPEYNLYYSYEMKRVEIGVSLHYNMKSTYPTSSILVGGAKDKVTIGLNISYPLHLSFNI